MCSRKAITGQNTQNVIMMVVIMTTMSTMTKTTDSLTDQLRVADIGDVKGEPLKSQEHVVSCLSARLEELESHLLPRQLHTSSSPSFIIDHDLIRRVCACACVRACVRACVHVCVCIFCIIMLEHLSIYLLFSSSSFLVTFSTSMYIMCVCLFSALGRRVGALQISIIIIITFENKESVLKTGKYTNISKRHH